MKLHSSFLAMLALLLPAVGPTVFGADASKEDAAVKPVAFKVSSRNEAVGNLESVMRVFITTETNQFTFILPRQFRFQTDNADRSLSLTAPDGSGLIKLRIGERSDTEMPKLDPQKVRDSLIEDRPDAKVVSEFSASAGNLIGIGVELQWRAAGDSMLNSRIAVIPFPGGTLEFSQTARAQQIRQLDQPLNQVLLSFRQASIDGKLNFAPLSDKL